MNEMDLKIDEIIKKSTENVFEVLRKNGFEIREKKNTYQKTEQLLYLIPNLKESVKHNKQKIDDLKLYGIEKKGSAVHVIPANTPVRKEESEIVDLEISKLLQRNHIINSTIKWVNEIISTQSKEKYFDIIDLKYFKNKTYEDMAEYFQCDTKTIGRNKNKLINNIKVLLFPNDSIDEIGN